MAHTQSKGRPVTLRRDSSHGCGSSGNESMTVTKLPKELLLILVPLLLISLSLNLLRFLYVQKDKVIL